MPRFHSVILPLTTGSVLLTIPLTHAFDFRQGIWNAEIKESDSSLTASSINCSYGGETDGAATTRALNSIESSVFVAGLTPTTASPPSGIPACRIHNLTSVAQAWNTAPCTSGRCTGLSPLVIGMMQNDSITPDASPLVNAAQNMSAIATSVGGSTVTYGIGVDDFQGVLADDGGKAFPNNSVTIAEVEAAYTTIKSTTSTSSIQFSPYLEAGRALYHVGDTVRLGMENRPGSTSDVAYEWPLSSSTSPQSISVTFELHAGSGYAIPLGLFDSGLQAEFPIVDFYADQFRSASTSQRNLFLKIEQSTDAGTSWSELSLRNLLNPEGNSNVQIYREAVDLTTTANRAALSSTTGVRIRFTLETGRTAGVDRVLLQNFAKMAVIGMPKLKVVKKVGSIKLAPSIPISFSFDPFQPADRSPSGTFWFGDLLNAAEPGYSITYGSAPSGSTRRFLSEKTPDSNRLITSSSGGSAGRRYLDGLLFKMVEEITYDARLHELILRSICRIPQSHGLACIEVGWGNSLQMPSSGFTLSAEREKERFKKAVQYADGYISFNPPLASLDRIAGVYSNYAPIGTIEGASQFLGTFLWPYETRMINGFTKSWTLTVPPAFTGGSITAQVNGTAVGGPTCLDSSSPLWRVSVTGSTGGAYGSFSVATSSSLSFEPLPSETLTFSMNPMTSPASLCGADLALAWGPSLSSGSWPIVNQTVSEAPEVNTIMTCLSHLFLGTVSSTSCPAPAP
jgi:hypothetical protein